MSSKVLVVDDDPFLLRNLEVLLSREGYSVRGASSGEEALSLLTDEPADLVVLDLGLPGIDGITTCRRLRSRWHMPVLMLTARTDAMDKVVGLEVGADDYLTKPFEPSEFVARVRAQLRRHTEYRQSQQKVLRLERGDVEIDFEVRQVRVGGKPVELTKREFEIVEYLAQNLGRAVARETLFEAIWGYEMEFNSNSLDVLIYRIRKKMEQDPNEPNHVMTLRGFGYKLQA
ncbi:MAG TPA: response regulator transcription factor [Fimbriimonadaceae bacterium]|nr:response regulator transcription factor [Fimbriimonadaceae bacterium]